jgi:hypothetical protein
MKTICLLLPAIVMASTPANARSAADVRASEVDALFHGSSINDLQRGNGALYRFDGK